MTFDQMPIQSARLFAVLLERVAKRPLALLGGETQVGIRTICRREAKSAEVLRLPYFLPFLFGRSLGSPFWGLKPSDSPSVSNMRL